MGFGIKKEAGSNTTPSEIVNFDKLTPTTVGVVFDPNTPQTVDVLYVSSVDASTWIWNGTAYVTYSAPATATTEWYLYGTTIDAGSNKTASISRSGAIYTSKDSSFNTVTVGKGGGNISSNVVLGLNAGKYNTTGASNTYLGVNSGANNTVGDSNVFIGRSSGQLGTQISFSVFAGAYSGGNTTANYNTFLGYNSGYINTTGETNTFVGYQSGYSNTTASDNTFIGNESGYTNTTGESNLFVGTYSGYNNTVGNQNTFIGKGSGNNNTTGSFNSFLGTSSGYSNTIGGSNLFLGKESGFNNTTGSNNSFLGVGSGSNNTTGSNNAFLGVSSGRFIADGVTPLTIVNNSIYLGRDVKSLANNQTNEIVIGYNAIGKGSNTVNIGDTFMTDGISNTFAGRFSGSAITTGSNNTFLGGSSGYNNTTGSNNTFLGLNSGFSNTTSVDNTFIGKSSGLSTTTGGGNTGNGVESLYSNTTGTSNVANGGGSLYSNTTGGGNTSNGIESLYSSTTGFFNTASGYRAGRYIADGTTALTASGNSIFLGADSKALANNQTNQIVIGYNAIGKGSNTVNIGNTSITNTYLNGAVTVNNAFTLPSTDGTANYFLKTNGSGVVTWGVAGLSFFSEAKSTTAPNVTVNVDSLTAIASTTNADFAIIPKGTGAIIAGIPDGTAAGGDKRGANAIDLQTSRTASNRVASGQYSVTLGYSNRANNVGAIAIGYTSDATGDRSIALGASAYALGQYSTAIAPGSYAGGYGSVAIGSNGLSNPTATGTAAVAIGGGTAGGDYSFATCFNSASGNQSVAMGGSYGGSGGAVASGTNSFALGSATRASGAYSMAILNNSDTYSHRNRLTYGTYTPTAGNPIGSIQGSTLVVGVDTTNAVATTLGTYGGTAIPLILQNNNSIRFKGTIVGRQSGSTNTSAWDIDGFIQRGTTAATTTLLISNVNLIQNTPAWGTPTLTADTTNGGLDIKVIGATTTNIRWTCVFTTTEVIYA